MEKNSLPAAKYQIKLQAAKQILLSNLYLTLATADEQGNPWISPLFYAFDKQLQIYWFSPKDCQHSRNLKDRKEVAMVIFDSHTPKWQGEGLYFKAHAQQIRAPLELIKGIRLCYAKLQETPPPPDQFSKLQQYRVFKAEVSEISITCDQEINGEMVDQRLQIEKQELLQLIR